MYTLFLSLTILTIVSQTIHTWFVFDSFSRLKGNLKLFQAVCFCGIISVAIFAFVLIGKPHLALLGAIIEIIINMYYYAQDFFENGIRARVKRAESIATFWRKNWVAIFFGILIPMLIYIFAKQMIELK
jgi:membrane associated rhomboid family serine protease